MPLSVLCQAEPSTGHLKIDHEQGAGSQQKNFVMKSGRRRFSENPSDISETKAYSGSDFPPDDNRHNPCVYGVTITTIESFSWQWLYATNLALAYELIPTIKDKPLSYNPYLWLPLKVIVGWLLGSYWTPDSPLFKLIELQSASMLRQGDKPFVTITTMFGSGHNPPQYPSSEPSGQQAPKATTHPSGYSTHPVYSDSGNGNEDPEQDSHTLGLNCFVHPCRGFCRLRTSTDSTEPNEWPLNSRENSTAPTKTAPGQSSHPHLTDGHCLSCVSGFASWQPFQPETHQPDDAGMPGNLSATADDLIIINGLLNLRRHRPPGETITSFTIKHLPSPMATSETQQTRGSSQLSRTRLSQTGTKQARDHSKQRTCDVTIVGENGQQRPCGKASMNAHSLSSHKSRYHSGQKACDMMVIGEDDQDRPCGKICMNTQALIAHKRKSHNVLRTCNKIVFGQDGQQRPCGTICNEAQALADHKKRYHSRRQTCDLNVVGQDGQLKPCGVICKNAATLSAHKSTMHMGQRACQLTVVGEDGQQRPCGKVCKNARALKYHRRKEHTGQQTCSMTVVAESGQQQPCGKICKSVQALSTHKRIVHTGQQTCDLTVVGNNGQQWRCGKVLNNAQALCDHKRRHHSGQKICEATLVGQDGQLRPCGSVCKNARALSSHKSSMHRTQKTCHLTVIEDGQPQLCGKLFKTARALSEHRRRYHGRQQTCDKTVVGEHGQQRPCEKPCKNAEDLAKHKRRNHTGQQTCDKTVVGEHGQQQPCGKLFKNSKALANHKRIHRKRKPADEDLHDDLSLQEGKVSK